MAYDKTELFLLKIKEKLTSEGNDDINLNMAFLEQAIRSAQRAFDEFQWIFYTYTDHKITHARNVVRLMYELLEQMNVLEQLSSLELAFCLLSAYYHDMGMLLTNDERNKCISQIREKRSRRRKVPITDQARETVAENNELLDYIRQNHGERVKTKLRQVEELSDGTLKWVWRDNGNCRRIRSELATICASHCKSIDKLAELLDLENMSPTGGEVNYMICCVALRIADLMDFDQTRVSKLRYYAAGLMASRLTPEEEYSKGEMQKHMQSCGFRVERTEDNLVFRITAQPKNPYFEEQIRNYAGKAYTEIEQSLRVLDSYTIKFNQNCHWRKDSFPFGLHAKLKDDNIKPDGYVSGDYQFQASKKELLQYFTGEELYNNRTVFFRELLQNAIDSCLFTKSMEKYDEGEDPHIEITYWVEKGSRWLQITDNGAGMDKNIIQKYFLKVGVSFYNSTEFIETLKKKSSHFTSIGRFGIGILSCFMVSNHVEVATRSRKITGNDDALYHLQMLNTSDKYTLRRDHDILSFPNKESLDIFDDGYGTSVVLKLRPDIGFSDETILDCLQEFVFLPGINIDYHYLDRTECMWDEKTLLGFEEKRVPYQLAYAESENVIRYYNGPYLADDLNLSPIHIFFEVLSLDIGKHCSDPGINGYLYVTLIYDETMTEREQVLDEYSGFTFHCDNNRVMLMKNQQTLASISFPDADFLGVDFGQIKVYFNGVLHTTAHIQGRPFYNICGKLSLSSDNRPDVHVSRDGSAAFSLRTLSMLNYAFRSAVRSLTKKNRHFRHIYDTITLPPILCSLDKIPSCSTIMGVDGIEELWLDERIIPTSLGRMSISEIQKYVSDYGEIQLMNIFYSKHIVSIIGTYLTQKYLKVKARFHNRKIEFVAFGSNDPKNCDVVLQDLPCFFFMEYEGTDHLRVENSPYNINHPLSQTVIQLMEEVKRTDNDRLNGYLQLLLNCLRVKYNTPDMLIQNLVIPVNQILAEIGSPNKITDRDFIINPEYGFELSKELVFEVQ